MATNKTVRDQAPALEDALRRQLNADDHDRALIAERLDWTPEQRLEANSSFLRWYFSIRPEGPLIGEK